ncbi:MAG: tRNA (adenosine(37)-N6)-dimethylallyltransferase MiaA [Acidimicrobiia bacterium]
MSRVLAIVGPTAAGKTEMAIELARRIGGEVLSVDSVMVYRGMDIGTAKPTLVERRGVPHHMIDVVDPEEEFSVAEFRRRGRGILKAATVPIVIVGGSGLHFRALVDPMSFAPTDPELRRELEEIPLGEMVAELTSVDPEAGAHVDLSNPRRVIRAVEIYRLTGETPSARATKAEAEDLRRYVSEVEFTAVGVDPGNLLEQRIELRTRRMRSGGLVGEVRRLQGRMGRTARTAVGYREMLAFLRGDLSEEEAFSQLVRNTRRLAKKQRTWFQRDPRIRWIPWSDDLETRVDRALDVLM